MKFIERLVYKKYCKKCREFSLKSLQQLQEENSYLNKQILNTNTLSKVLDTYKQLICVKEMHGRICLVTVNQRCDYNGYLKDINFFVLVQAGTRFIDVMHLNTHFSYEICYSTKCMEIDEISGEPNRGYGSLLMKCFLDYIKEFKTKHIFGTLSPADEADEENKARRNHFYEKFGFKIEGNEIHLYLQN